MVTVWFSHLVWSLKLGLGFCSRVSVRDKVKIRVGFKVRGLGLGLGLQLVLGLEGKS